MFSDNRIYVDVPIVVAIISYILPLKIRYLKISTPIVTSLIAQGSCSRDLTTKRIDITKCSRFYNLTNLTYSYKILDALVRHVSKKNMETDDYTTNEKRVQISPSITEIKSLLSARVKLETCLLSHDTTMI